MTLLDLTEYQREALKTNHNDLSAPGGLIPPLLGLASETGSILNIYKKILRDSVDQAHAKEFLRVELGDLLWYMAVVAESHHLSLDAIARENLLRASQRYALIGAPRPAPLPSFDGTFPFEERFPRRLLIHFREEGSAENPRVCVSLVDAQPNAFPDGPRVIETPKGTRTLGFQLRCDLPVQDLQPTDVQQEEAGFAKGPIGDPLYDNANELDGYRYHDALHLAFMGVLGWSPTWRALLQVKRRSIGQVNEVQDGARAFFAEEGLAHALYELSKARLGFQSEKTVNSEVLALVKAVVRGLEVAQQPDWLWADAISQGFRVMTDLQNGQNKKEGGYVLVDLENRRVTYSRERPVFQ